jgi:hypothetical protein
MPSEEIKYWIAPLLVEALDRGIDLQPETETATETPEGQPYGPMNWILFGQLVIQRLGLLDRYPAEPHPGLEPPYYVRMVKSGTEANLYSQVYKDFINRY